VYEKNNRRKKLKTKDCDYHWYRQLPNGQWAHKPGELPATKLDFGREKSIIYDPETCNRHYPGGVNYSVFLGFYQVKTPLKKIIPH
jgi:hypothetical protein